MWRAHSILSCQVSSIWTHDDFSMRSSLSHSILQTKRPGQTELIPKNIFQTCFQPHVPLSIFVTVIVQDFHSPLMGESMSRFPHSSCTKCTILTSLLPEKHQIILSISIHITSYFQHVQTSVSDRDGQIILKPNIFSHTYKEIRAEGQFHHLIRLQTWKEKQVNILSLT